MFLLQPSIRTIIFSVGLLFASIASASLTTVPDDVERWSTGFVPSSGCNGEIRALADTQDVNGRVVVAGNFTVCGDTLVNRVALYDPINEVFEALGSSSLGVNGPINTALVHNNILYVGGTFTQAGGIASPAIAQYDLVNEQWAALETGMTSSSPKVNDLVIFDGDLYVGGDFSQVSGAPAADLIAWDLDGGEWLSAPPGTANGEIKTLLVADDGQSPSNDQLYVGGSFTGAGGVSMSYVGAFQNNTWSALNTVNIIDHIHDLAFYDNRVFVVGENQALVAYTPASGNWSSTLGFKGTTIIAASTGLYLSGEQDDDAALTDAIVQLTWNSSNQSFTSSALVGTNTGQDMDAVANALLLVGNKLWIGGAMQTVGNFAVNGLAIWNEVATEFEAVAPTARFGLSRQGQVLANIDGAIYAGGDFSTAGFTVAPGIARWTGSQWDALGSTPLVGTTAIAKHADTLWAGGAFVNNGDGLPKTLARYDADGDVWQVVTDEPSSSGQAQVNALASFNDVLVVGGSFIGMGDLNLPNLSVLDTSNNTWGDLGGALPNGPVNAFATDGTGIYVGGAFTELGGTGFEDTAGIGYFDGSSWSSLAAGLAGTVNAIDIQTLTNEDQTTTTNVFVGGAFTVPGESNPWNIARWDGSAWQPVGDGLNGTVKALAVYDDVVFAAGEFTSTQFNVPTLSYVARWDGANWTALAGGVNAPVSGLAVSDIGEVFITGSFDRTSKGPSTNVALYAVPACEPGTFSASGYQPCQACPEGEFTSLTGVTSCDKCPQGRQPTEDATSCELCPAGTSSPGEGTVCQACPEGRVQPLSGQNDCVACVQGQYQDETGQTECKACELGTANNGFGAVACTDCSPGTYADEPGLKTCKTCPAGQSQPGSKATKCLDCEAGRQGSADRTSCVACPLGTFSDTPGEACQDCPEGKIAATQGQTGCTLCEIGQYQPQTGQSACLNCAAGKQGTADRTDCENCPVGKAALAGQGCVACAAGTFQDKVGQATCENCSEGRYQPATGQTFCLDCEEGKFNDQPGMSTCQACQPGAFSSFTGAVTCLDCEPGSYAPDPGATACLVCNETTDTGDEPGATACVSNIIFIDRFQQGAWFLPKARCLQVEAPSRV